MMRTLLFMVILGLPWAARSADCPSSHSPDLDKLLGLHMPANGTLPGGWSGNPPGNIVSDSQVTQQGTPSVRIERSADSTGPLSAFSTCIKMDFTGSKIELRGFLRTEAVQGDASLWLREDANGHPLALASFRDAGPLGNTDWKQYSVTLPRSATGQVLYVGAYLQGTGKVWVSDMQLLVDGRPIWQAPAALQTVLDTDHQFDQGSGIIIGSLNNIQIANLITLGKVWGFLKYYHPVVRAGQKQWDFELFRILPAVLGAPDRASANAVLLHWIKALGAVGRCDPCTTPDESQRQLEADLAWIADQTALGKDLSQALVWIRDNGRGKQQFFVDTESAASPMFPDELPYADVHFPDPGYQLLGLYRFWNIVEYWYPYRNVIGEDWDGVLSDSISGFALAHSRDDYARQMMRLIAKIHDSHADLLEEPDLQPPVGDCQLPVQLRYVEGRPVVIGLTEGTAPRFKVGDVLTELDSVPVEQLVKDWAPYYGASNQAALFRNIARRMTRGPCGQMNIEVQRDDKSLHMQVTRSPIDWSKQTPSVHDLPGPTFRLLSPEVAYLKMSSIRDVDLPGYIRQAAGTKGLIVDIRDYPSDEVVFGLGSLLVTRETPFVRFTEADPAEPGAMYWAPPISLSPAEPHYGGKVVILVDEASQSHAEYTALALRSVPGAVVVGSTTAGADGNVSKINLPGGMSTMISGLGVFYPDKRPTQRVGIVPDVVVEPTLAGIRAGRDEVMEKALRLILGPGMSDTQIEKMYRDHRAE